MIQKGSFNITVYQDCNIDQKTNMPYHLTIIEKFNKKEQCIAKRTLYINGSFAEIRAYFKRISTGDIERLCGSTKNNKKLCINEIDSWNAANMA